MLPGPEAICVKVACSHRDPICRSQCSGACVLPAYPYLENLSDHGSHRRVAPNRSLRLHGAAAAPYLYIEALAASRGNALFRAPLSSITCLSMAAPHPFCHENFDEPRVPLAGSKVWGLDYRVSQPLTPHAQVQYTPDGTIWCSTVRGLHHLLAPYCPR